MLTEGDLEKDVRQALASVKHPEINLSLMDLGMIKDVIVGCKAVTFTLALPFLWVPIRDYFTILFGWDFNDDRSHDSILHKKNLRTKF